MPPRKRKATVVVEEDKASQGKKRRMKKGDNADNEIENENDQVEIVQKEAPGSETVNDASSGGAAEDTFHDFDFNRFWVRCSYSDEEYRDVEPLTDAVVQSVEKKLGYKLPKAYIDLCRHQNGGLLKRQKFSLDRPFPFDSVYATGIFGIGKSKNYSLCGRMGSAFWMKEWRYPKFGIYFADTPSGGHDMFCLDYRKCGRDGEPEVVKIDQEGDYEVLPVAKDFESFIRGLDYCEKLGVPLDDDEKPAKSLKKKGKK